MRLLAPLALVAAACAGSPSAPGSGSSSSGSSGSGGTGSGSSTGGSSSTTSGSTSSGSSSGASQTGSLQGFEAFTPNAILAVMLVLADGGTLRNQIEIGMFDSDPTAACGNFVSGFPPTGTAAGEVAIFATRKETISPGTYNIVDYSLFEATTVDPDASLAAIEVGIPTVPPGPHLANSGGGLSGTLTFTSVGPEWVGSFSATIVYDGKESPLSGTFATSTSCVVVP